MKQLTQPEHSNPIVLPWKGNIVSGAISQATQEKIMDEYLSDDLVRKRNFHDHEKDYKKWASAEKEKQFNARVYR